MRRMHFVIFNESDMAGHSVVSGQGIDLVDKMLPVFIGWVSFPDFLFRNVHHAIPKGNIIMPIDPLRSEMPVEEQAQFRRNPCRGMDAVGNRSDGNLIFREVRPNNLPHAASHSAMKMAYCV